MGVCNPITDMSIGVYTLYIVLAIWGNDFFSAVVLEKGLLFKACPALSTLDVFYYLSLIIMSGNVIFCVIKIFIKERFEGKGREAKGLIVFFQAAAYLIMVLAVTSIAYIGQNPLIS